MKLMQCFVALICLVLGGIFFLTPIDATALWMFSRGKPAAIPASAQEPIPVPAKSSNAFLNSIGVNLHVDQGYKPESYISPLRYTGVHQARDGDRNIASDVMIHRETGVRFTISAGGNLDGLLAAARSLAAAGALTALEGPNEPNNFAISYGGMRGGGPGGTWVPVARFQKDLYAAVKADVTLRHYPVFGPSETGAETDDVGLQFLVVPSGAGALFPAGTHFADYANVHNYVIGNGNTYGDNQAWNAADPTLNERWDGLYGNNGVTWHGHYTGYSNEELPTVPRVTTETGWDTVSNPGGERTQGTVLTNTYLAQFKRGWSYTFVYEMRDDEGGSGNQGLYHGTTPKLAATYLHNLTTLLSDDRPIGEVGSLNYAIPDEPATVHDLLLQTGTGQFKLIVWDERMHGNDVVTVNFHEPWKIVKIYDITLGTEPIRVLANADSVHLTLSDHALIVELGGKPAGPVRN